MANRYLHPTQSLDQAIVKLLGKVVFGAAGVIGSQDSNGFAVSKPGAVGLYRITLEDDWLSLLDVGTKVLHATGDDLEAQVQAVDLSVNKRIDLQLLRRACFGVSTPKAVDGAAGNATAEFAVGAMPFGATILAAKYVPDGGALVADNANYATLIVRKRAVGGGGATPIAQVTTQIAGGSGNWAQWAPVDIPLLGSTMAAGALTFEITKTGTGVVIPKGVLQLQLSMATPADAPSGAELRLELTFRNSSRPRKGGAT